MAGKTKNLMRTGISFMVQATRMQEPLLLLLLIACVLFTVLSSVLAVALPAVAVGIVSGEVRSHAGFIFLSLSAVFVLLSALSGGAQQGRGMRQLYLAKSMLYRAFLKRMDVPYDYAESAPGRQAYEKVRQICRWGTDFRLLFDGLIDLSVSILTFVLYAGLLGGLNVCFMLLLTGLSVVNYVMLRRVDQANELRREDQAAEYQKFFYLTNTAQNAAIGKDVRLYGMASMLESLMDRSLERIRSISAAFQRQVSRAGVAQALTALVRDGLAYGFLIDRAVRGDLTVTEFVLFFGVVSQFSGFSTRFVQSYATLRTGCTAMAAVKAYFEMPGASNAAAGAQADPIAAGARCGASVELTDVRFSYDGRHNVIDGLNLKIEAGEKIALVGVNGAGKTTLVKLLCGLYPLSAGEIRIQGEPLDAMEHGALSSKLAVLFQEALILPYTVAENVSLSPLENTDEARVAECLDRVNLLSDILKHPGGLRAQMTKAVDADGIELSGGQRQKLLMARVLYRQAASVVILDEPTASLDPLAESEVYEQFHRLFKDQTCIFISHRLAGTQFLDRILVLEQGRIIETGTHQALLKKGGRYAQLFALQSRYYREEPCDEPAE